MKGRLIGVISFDKFMQLSIEIKNAIQLLYSKVFRSMFYKFSLLSSKVGPIC